MSQEIIYLSNDNWDKPKPFPKKQALKMLKNQKSPGMPAKFRNAYKVVPKPDTSAQTTKEGNAKNSSKQGSDKKDTSKAQ